MGVEELEKALSEMPALTDVIEKIAGTADEKMIEAGVAVIAEVSESIDKKVEDVLSKKVKSVKVRESTLTVMRTIPKSMKDAGADIPDEEKTLDIHKFVTEPAKIELTYGKKTMIRKFEPVEIRLSVQMPCYKEEMKDAYEFLQGFLTDIMKKEMESLEASMEGKKKVLTEGGSDGSKSEGGGESGKDGWY